MGNENCHIWRDNNEYVEPNLTDEITDKVAKVINKEELVFTDMSSSVEKNT